MTKTSVGLEIKGGNRYPVSPPFSLPLLISDEINCGRTVLLTNFVVATLINFRNLVTVHAEMNCLFYLQVQVKEKFEEL